MRALIDFLAPFVSERMPASFQRGEMIAPVVFAVLMACIATFPLFATWHWITGVFGVVVWSFVMYLLQAAIMRSGAERMMDGSLYISPSVVPIRHGMILFASLALTMVVFSILGRITGLLHD